MFRKHTEQTQALRLNGHVQHRRRFICDGQTRITGKRHISIDVDDFNSTLAQARAASNSTVRMEWYERAVSLYCGEYLQNLYYEWVFPERRRLTQAHLVALQELASYQLSYQNPKRAVTHIEKAIPLDQLNEELQCLGMRAYAETGGRASLVHVYSQLQNLLHRELGITPLPETAILYQELLNTG